MILTRYLTLALILSLGGCSTINTDKGDASPNPTAAPSGDTESGSSDKTASTDENASNDEDDSTASHPIHHHVLNSNLVHPANINTVNAGGGPAT